jgi:RHS repeat-associated protein
MEGINYIHKDHFGSWNTITHKDGNLLQELSFDACSVKPDFRKCSEAKSLVEPISAEARGREGNRRDPATWRAFADTPPEPLFDRGFTGHEHLDVFGLINMNGRVYDPVVARFLSPDPYIKAPNMPQNYNGYVYCLNNPLVYTDPSGEFFIGTILTSTFDFLATIFVKGGIDPWNTPENRQAAWKDFDPTAQWSPTNKAWKIDIGGFKTDPNRNIWGRSLQLISRWTWELPQTVFGKGYSHIRNMSGNVDDVSYYGGATLVNKDEYLGKRWGLTLGPYINSQNVDADPYTDDLFRHEFGHTLQSRLVGPFYLFHVGIPSLIGSGLENIGLNDHNREWYETQANRMSFRYFNNHDPEVLSSNETPYGPRQGPWQNKSGLSWDDIEYPRKYNPNWYWSLSHPPLPFLWWLFF